MAAEQESVRITVGSEPSTDSFLLNLTVYISEHNHILIEEHIKDEKKN